MTKSPDTYHPRRPEKEITDRADLLAVIRGQKFLTLALCSDNRPYLVTMNYAYDEAENCFYMHSAAEGRKLDILRANPLVWGQVLEDRGYVAGKCTHHYRCVMFEGRAEMVEDLAARRTMIEKMIDFYEGPNGKVKAASINDKGLARIAFIRIRVTAMMGKENPAAKE